MSFLEEIRRLHACPILLQTKKRASVALLIRITKPGLEYPLILENLVIKQEDCQLLVIKRAEREIDPWSGNVV